MTGPVAAARPLLRPGSTFLLKQLSGPISRPITPSFSSFRPYTLPPIYLAPSLQRSQLRFYTSNPNSPDDPNACKLPEVSTESTAAEPTTSSEQPSPSQDQQPNDPPSTDPDPELPSQADSRRTALSQSLSTAMDNLQSRVLTASQTLNDLTGYSAIEKFKAANARLEADLNRAQDTLRAARIRYKAVNAQRASTQREVTTLLARKDTWSPSDLERFTTLYRLDHENEAAVSDAATALTEAEQEQSRLSSALNSGILKRYHEEQIWSDRIRRQSTWGTWGLMGVNVLLFMVLQFVAEPWKRNRLMRGIAAEEKGALDAVRRELVEVKDALVKRDSREAEAEEVAAASKAASASASAAELEEQAGRDAAAAVAAMTETEVAIVSPPMVESRTEETALSQLSWKEFLLDPAYWRPAFEDLYSDRRIELRMRDASLIALEGAVVGAAVMGSIALFFLRRN